MTDTIDKVVVKTKETVVAEVPQRSIVQVGHVGPPGVAGPAGPTGPAGAVSMYIRYEPPTKKASAYRDIADDLGVGDTITIGSLTFVAVAGSPAAQNEFQIGTGGYYTGANSYTTAQNLYNAILAHSGYAAESWVVTNLNTQDGTYWGAQFKAKVGGTAANSIVFSAVSAGGKWGDNYSYESAAWVSRAGIDTFNAGAATYAATGSNDDAWWDMSGYETGGSGSTIYIKESGVWVSRFYNNTVWTYL